MNLQAAGIGSIGVGAVFFVLSFLWSTLVPNKAVWTEDKAVEYQQVSAQLHDDANNPNVAEEDLAASQAAFDEIDRQLQRAKTIKDSTPFYLRVGALAVSLLGVGCIVFDRAQEDD